jgi:hypothetical protein
MKGVEADVKDRVLINDVKNYHSYYSIHATSSHLFAFHTGS